ncbi:MAG: hypothetical protein LBE50_05800 [Gallionellaceae bacterium]|jgi:toxin CptA|nr:hypothetical protein [Gallionellaceae bacterium]
MNTLPLRFSLTPSRQLIWVLGGMHATAMAALLVLTLPLWVKAGLIALLAFSLLYCARRQTAPDAIVALSLSADDVMLVRRDGTEVSGRLQGNSTVTPYLSILNVRPHGRRLSRSVVVLPDSLDAESFRRLRVWLKWGRG